MLPTDMVIRHNLDARRKISAWRNEYNHERPHSSLGFLMPVELYAANAAHNLTNTEETVPQHPFKLWPNSISRHSRLWLSTKVKARKRRPSKS